jgi:hypothetical protein
MSGTSGFSNQKKLGKSEFVTVHSAGSDRKGLATSQLYLADVNAVAVAISAVTQSNDKKITYVDLGTAHDARLGDVLRMTTGTLIQWEFEIIEIPSANIVGIFNIAPTLPLATEEVKVCRWVTAKSDDQGALQVSQGPLQYTRNGAVQEVIEDTAVAANNRPLPAGLYIIKDGVATPVSKDTGTPANTLAVPVEIVAASGTPINITAGDINIQLTDLGANFDACRIGDGSGNYIGVNASSEAKVHDASVLTQVTAINAKDIATSAKQDTGNTSLSSIDGKFTTLNAKDFATSAKQDTGNTSLASIDGKVATSAKQDTGNTSLASIDGKFTTLNAKDFATSAKQDAEAVLVGPVTETAPATDTASSGLNGRLQRIAQRITSLIALLPSTLGQKTGANSLAVVMASDFIPASPAVPSTLTLKHANVSVGVAAVRATTDGSAVSSTRRLLRIFVDPDDVTNSAKFYVGASTVTASGATKGEQIFPGAPFVRENDANDFYIISDTASQKFTVIEEE